MRKLFLTLFAVGGFLLFAPNTVSAQGAEEGTLRHAYKPVVVSTTGAVRARVDNFSTAPVKRLVCVEAFNNISNAKTHIGCLWVELDSYNSTGMWAKEFDAPTTMLMPGSYRVVYTYQGTDQVWYRVKSLTMQVEDGMVTK